MVEVNQKHVRAFPDAAALESWLEAHHDRESELWLKIYKQGSGERTVSYREAVEVALCWGWIDGLKKSLDERAFLQRFSPRRPRSVWSQINRELVAKLIDAGRMRTPGLAHVLAAQADGRWAAAYASPRTATVPPELLAAIEANPRALATYQTLDRANVFALGFRLLHMKTPAGRERKLTELVELLARGETPYPLSTRRAAAGASPTAAPARKAGAAPAPPSAARAAPRGARKKKRGAQRP